MLEVATVDDPRVVVLDTVFADDSWLSSMFAANGPYWNQGRYLSAAGAASQMPGHVASTIGVPWYRQDWALGGEPLVPGAAHILGYAPFVDAAREVFGGSVVRAHTVYANVQLPAVGTDFGHTDVPEFRGVTRDRFPVALLHLMNRSGLFRSWQLDICTAVTWVWRGPRGDFVLWDSGPDRSPRRYEPPLTGLAVVSDNDRVFHAVGDFASPDGPAPGLLTPTSEVHVKGDHFALVDGGSVHGRWLRTAVRQSVSWKAYVFADEHAAREYDEHRDDLDGARVLATFTAELARRGVEHGGLHAIDDSLIATLAAVWPKQLPTPQ